MVQLSESVGIESQKIGDIIMIVIMMSRSSAALRLRLRPVPLLRGNEVHCSWVQTVRLGWAAAASPGPATVAAY